MALAVTSREAQDSSEPDIAFRSNDERWLLAKRIASSEIFARSEFLPRFLLHVCSFYLQNRTEELHEQQIGVAVFKRLPTYNPGDDNVVRNYAVQLRKRLDLYYEGAGRDEPLRITIPRGAYLPVFIRTPRSAPILDNLAALVEFSPGHLSTEAQPDDSLSQMPSRKHALRLDWRTFFLGLAAGGALAYGVAFRWTPPRPQPAPRSATNPLWSAMFTRNRETLVVPADSGLGILQNLTEAPTTLADYESGKYFSRARVKGADQGNLNDLRTQRYTSMVDLTIASRLSRLAEVVPDRLIVKFARDLRVDNLKSDNVILLGAIHTDPWVSPLQETLNFQFSCGKRVDDCYISNSLPRRGELSVYRSDLTNQSHKTYAMVALRPNLDRNGWILMIEGLNMAGTEAAANILLDDAMMGPVLLQASTHAGRLRPFELLIETKSIDAEALPAKIVATRFAD